MVLTTKELAEKLWQLADFLEAEKKKMEAIHKTTNNEDMRDAIFLLNKDIDETRKMAKYLWDKKETI